LRLKDKIAFITGAGGPMGEAIALRFAEEGAKIVIIDISGNRLNLIKLASLNAVLNGYTRNTLITLNI
jgi:NAD(P)-dependent dehydrogenase (short-subunit alcohol dehydrogenase family)